VPLIYSGQEQPNRKRLEFFEKDALSWQDEPAKASLYQKMSLLRRHYPLHAAFQFLEMGEKVLSFRLQQDDQIWYVILNLNHHDMMIDFDDAMAYGNFIETFSSTQTTFSGRLNFVLPKAGYKVYIKN
jgi:hypothetical protein